MRIHFVIHESYEGPGAFSHWVASRGHEQTETRLYLGEALPAESAFDWLIVLGGPQSPETTQAECPHFNAQAETDLIVRSIHAGKAVIGVCLGAQLIGEALGAAYQHSPEREIGYFPIRLTGEGKQDSLFAHFGETETVGHWHNDMPGLLPSFKILAESAGCPRQVVKFMNCVYGFQCHLEFTQASMADLVRCSFDASLVGQQHPWIQDQKTLLTTDTARMNDLLWTFLDQLVVHFSDRHGLHFM